MLVIAFFLHKRVSLRTLILGYGNQDRQDDGVAWHIMADLRKRLGYSDPQLIDENFDSTDDLVFVFQLQLTPELADDISRFDRICFLDAHTGAVPEDVNFEKLSPIYQHSPLTHHLTASSLLSILQTVYKRTPEAILISVKGLEFGYSTVLSPFTQNLVSKASEMVLDWVKQGSQ